MSVGEVHSFADARAMWSIVETAVQLDTSFEPERRRRDGVTSGPRS